MCVTCSWLLIELINFREALNNFTNASDSVIYSDIARVIQGGQKKLHTELMAITLSIINGFSKFFHC